MDEPTAWLRQAIADRNAAERFVTDEKGTGRCHAIAKWQQTVEKAVKALVAALRDAGVLGVHTGGRHEVEPLMRVLIRLPRHPDNRALQNHLHGLLDQNTRMGIRALDALVPRLPPRRNTEYPFQSGASQWTYPAAEGVFSQQEIERFRALAHRVVEGAGQLVSAVRRRPR